MSGPYINKVNNNSYITNYDEGGPSISSNNGNNDLLNNAQVSRGQPIQRGRNNTNQLVHNRQTRQNNSFRNAQVISGTNLRQPESTSNDDTRNAARGGSSSGANSNRISNSVARRPYYGEPRNMNEALAAIRNSGFMMNIGHTGAEYTAGINKVFRNANVGEGDISHIIPMHILHGALKKAYLTVRDTPRMEDIKRLTDFCQTHTGARTHYYFRGLKAANNLTDVRDKFRDFTQTIPCKNIGFHTPSSGDGKLGFVNIRESTALIERAQKFEGDLGIPLNADTCPHNVLRTYKNRLYELMADYSLSVLSRHLRSNLANLFVPTDTDPETSYLGDMSRNIGRKASMDAKNVIVAMDDSNTVANLRDVTNNWLTNLQEQHASLLADKSMENINDEQKVNAELANALRMLAERIENAFTAFSAHGDLELLKTEQKNNVRQYRDSLVLNDAMKRDMTEKMEEVFHLLEEFGKAPSGSSLEPLLEALEKLYAAHYELLRNHGVPEEQLTKFLYQKGEAEADLIRHILWKETMEHIDGALPAEVQETNMSGPYTNKVNNNSYFTNYGVGGSSRSSNNGNTNDLINNAQVVRGQPIRRGRNNANQTVGNRQTWQNNPVRNTQVIRGTTLGQMGSTSNYGRTSEVTGRSSSGADSYMRSHLVSVWSHQNIDGPRSEREAAAKIRDHGFMMNIGMISGEYMRGVSKAIGEAKMSQILPTNFLNGKLKKAYTTLQETHRIEDIRILADLCQTHATIKIKFFLNKLEGSNSLFWVRKKIKDFCEERGEKNIGFHMPPTDGGQWRFVNINEAAAFRERVQKFERDLGIQPNDKTCPPEVLALYLDKLYGLIADYSLFQLARHLESNLANSFVQVKTAPEKNKLSDELINVVKHFGLKAGIELKVMEVINAINNTDTGLREVMVKYLDDLQEQHASLLAEREMENINDKPKVKKQFAEGAELQGDRIQNAFLKYSLLELELLKMELIDIVLTYHDSFEFNPAQGPHHPVNRDLNEKMGEIFPLLAEFGSAPHGSSLEPLFEAIEKLYEAHYDLLRNYGVPEWLLASFVHRTKKAEVDLMRHILFDGLLPEEHYVPYKCTEFRPFSGPFTVVVVGEDREQQELPPLTTSLELGAVHQDYADRYDGLMEQLDGEIMFGHATARRDEAGWTHALVFDYHNKARNQEERYHFFYDVDEENNEITDAALFAESSIPIRENGESTLRMPLVWTLLPRKNEGDANPLPEMDSLNLGNNVGNNSADEMSSPDFGNKVGHSWADEMDELDLKNNVDNN